jgi:hypothetical protein
MGAVGIDARLARHWAERFIRKVCLQRGAKAEEKVFIEGQVHMNFLQLSGGPLR